MNDLSDSALVDLKEARRYVYRNENDASRDDILIDAVNLVSSAILDHLGRSILTEEGVAKLFTVDESGFVDLRPHELRAVDSVLLHPDREASLQQTLTASDYRLFPAGLSAEGTYLWMQLEAPALRPLQPGFYWQVEITGDWGFADTPETLKLAALQWVKNIVDNPGGYASHTMNGYTVVPDGEFTSGAGMGMPAAVRHRLRPYRRSLMVV